MMYQQFRGKKLPPKKNMAVFIASKLFNKPVSSENWKVKELMKNKKDELLDLFVFTVRWTKDKEK